MNTHHVNLALAASALTLVACAGTSPSSSQTQPQTVVTTPPPEGSVPAGSRMMVRMTQSLNSGRQGAGTRFTATLEANLVDTDGTVVAERGATVYGQLAQAQSAGRLAGRSEMTIILTDILIDNQLVPIRTSSVQAVSQQSSGGGTARNVAAGAAVGGIASGSSGARRGAAVGLGVSALSRGGQINIPAGTILDFQLGDHLVK